MAALAEVARMQAHSDVDFHRATAAAHVANFARQGRMTCLPVGRNGGEYLRVVLVDVMNAGLVNDNSRIAFATCLKLSRRTDNLVGIDPDHQDDDEQDPR